MSFIGIKPDLDLSSEAYFLAEFARGHPSQSLVRITTDLKSALTLKQNLEFFLGEREKVKVLFFSPHDTLPYTGLISGSDIASERIATLNSLLSNEPFILIAPWPALFRKVMPPAVLKKERRQLRLKEEVLREDLVAWLVDHGYRQEVVVESSGDFALRGAIVDIFPPQENYPLRLEFDGDCLVEIRRFDSATQITLKTDDSLVLIPASEVLYLDEFVSQALKQIKKFADELELPATLRRGVAEKIETKQNFVGKETFLPYFYDPPATLLDYLPPNSLCLAAEPAELNTVTQQIEDEIKGLYQTTKSIERLVPPSVLLNDFESLQEKLKTFCELDLPQATIWSSAELKRQWSLAQLKKWQDEKFKIRLVCHTKVQADRLKDILEGTFPSIIRPSHNVGERPTIEIGNLSHGFGWVEKGLIILTEEEIFGHKTRRPLATPSKIPFPSFLELSVGDHLVHEEHGICRTVGLQHLKIGAVLGDYLALEFLGHDKLYLPITRLNVVQRYVGGGTPILDSLRGTRWQKVKARARKEIFKIAAELLRVHAERSLHPGCPFPPPDTLDEEFASHFPFDETPDQTQAIEDVYRDLQRPQPMDRLVCGDVGYGKTEVAMRSAFKAVNAGKQAAFLVPTTILALQHFETFLERFSKLAVSVAMLSRFSSKKEQRSIVADIAQGKIDIAIGTHRLLKEDVRFKNLGLLIVDEEQHFGVRHKERIKKLRPTVDVLTLSATPIPRTLHMSLIGLRDLSMIHTPPIDRHAIRTFLAKWDEALIKQAIRQELDRGGQVFFVHNRVATIPSIYQRLKDLFPDHSIAVAHGQMREHDLEKVMIDFLHHRIEILLTTAIIESGIDVPNANTILINRADMFGLAQLYQLRGRVGRSDRQAYCYLLVPDEESLTKEARQRLSVLTRHTELGAGFQIASHDLEIRGAGNLLGSSQSGFVEEIGYELYTKLLGRAIRKLKGEEIELEEIDTEIQISVPAYIPETHVADTHLRMGLYKRMAHLGTVQEIWAFEQELRDRFGECPEPVKNLLAIIEIKQEAARLGLKTLKAKSLAEAKNVLREAEGWTRG